MEWRTCTRFIKDAQFGAFPSNANDNWHDYCPLTCLNLFQCLIHLKLNIEAPKNMRNSCVGNLYAIIGKITIEFMM